MKLSIISNDKTVCKDGVCYIDLALENIPVNVRALQWDGGQGHIEFNDGKVNEDILKLPSWAHYAVLIWEDANNAVQKVEIADTIINDQLKEIYAQYPVASTNAINEVLSKPFKNLQLGIRYRDTDSNPIGVQVLTVAGEELGTGAQGLISIKDATEFALSLGVPLISDAKLPADKVETFANYLKGFGHSSIFANGTLYLYYPWDLQLAKARKNSFINDERDQKLNDGVIYNGYEWDVDAESRGNITAQVSAITAGIVDGDITWRTKDNFNITMTQAEFKVFAEFVLTFVQDVYQHSWDRKALLNDADTFEEIEAV